MSAHEDVQLVFSFPLLLFSEILTDYANFIPNIVTVTHTPIHSLTNALLNIFFAAMGIRSSQFSLVPYKDNQYIPEGRLCEVKSD